MLTIAGNLILCKIDLVVVLLSDSPAVSTWGGCRFIQNRTKQCDTYILSDNNSNIARNAKAIPGSIF